MSRIKETKPQYATSLIELIMFGVYFGSSTILRNIQSTVLKYLKANAGLTCSLTTETWLLTASDQKRKGTLENESMKVTSEKIIINGSDEDSLQKNKQYIGRILALEHRYSANNKDEFLREIEAVNNKIMASFRLEDKLLFERVLKGL